MHSPLIAHRPPLLGSRNFCRIWYIKSIYSSGAHMAQHADIFTVAGRQDFLFNSEPTFTRSRRLPLCGLKGNGVRHCVQAVVAAVYIRKFWLPALGLLYALACIHDKEDWIASSRTECRGWHLLQFFLSWATAKQPVSFSGVVCVLSKEWTAQQKQCILSLCI